MNSVAARVTKCITSIRSSANVLVAMVYATLMVDNMLLSAVVPILPEYFYKEHLEEMLNASVNTSSSTIAPSFSEGLFSTIGLTAIPETSNNISFLEKQIMEKNCSKASDINYLTSESLYIGILFASKPIVQILANAAVGPIVDVIGYDIPMLFGYVVMCTSSLIFSFGKTYSVLLAARAIQGIGSASAATAGMGMLAERFTDDEQRGKFLGIALGGLAMGVLVGPTFGSVVYELAGKESVFLVLAALAFLLACFQLLIREIKLERNLSSNKEGSVQLFALLKDPYMFIVTCGITFANLSIGVLEAGLPLWMLKTMCSPKWALGVAFLPISVSYLIMTNVSAFLFQSCSRWLIGLISLWLITAGCVGLPFAKSLTTIIPSGLVIGGAVGVADASMFPIVGFLVDNRHKPIYGSAFAIADMAFCVAFFVGPLATGALTKVIGFEWLMWTVAIVTFLFSPLFFFLRKPLNITEETMPILYRNTDNDDRVFEEESNGSMIDSP